MKYPKLWDGSSPVGEALVRALQRTGEPFLRASTADGTTAATMNGFQQVRQGNPPVLLTWQGTVGSEQALWRVRQPGRTLNPSKEPFPPLSDTNTGTVRLPAYTSGAGGGAVYGMQLDLETVGERDVTLFRIPHLGKPTRVGTYKLYPNTATTPVSAALLLQGDRRKWTWGVVASRLEVDKAVATYNRVDTDANGDRTIVGVPIYSSWQWGRFYGGVAFRILPDWIRHYSFDIKSDDFFLPSRFEFAARNADGLGKGWSLSSEPGLFALFEDNGGGSFTYDNTFGHSPVAYNVSISLKCAPLKSGEVLILARAVRSQYGSDSFPHAVTFDAANADPWPMDGSDQSPASGVTILRGKPGSAQVVARVKLPGRALEPIDVAVSGDKIVALIEDAKFHRFIYTNVSSASWHNPKYNIEPPLLLFSDDSGVSWTLVQVPTSPPSVGLLSVNEDGEFMLPILSAEGEWLVFAFRDADFTEWRVVGRAEREESDSQIGCVFQLSRVGRASKPLPGTPWVSDDRITPPWEIS